LVNPGQDRQLRTDDEGSWKVGCCGYFGNGTQVWRQFHGAPGPSWGSILFRIEWFEVFGDFLLMKVEVFGGCCEIAVGIDKRQQHAPHQHINEPRTANCTKDSRIYENRSKLPADDDSHAECRYRNFLSNEHTSNPINSSVTLPCCVTNVPQTLISIVDQRGY
jgi:hypothetical protein